jgi:para-nitrobenzyl esterase
MARRATRAHLFVVAVTLAAAPPLRATEPVLVTVDSGALRGTSDDTVARFEGIPYARPPLGRLRWRPPQAPASWKGERDATGFGPVCPQEEPGLTVGGDSARASEDCLTLNVFAPAHPRAPAPVLVWLHGGGNNAGAGSRRYYDGTGFARDGVVLVTLNYRLGRLGFFAHPALTRAAPAGEPLADYGLMDQIAALRWVRRNIGAFGGDSAAVTLAGESSGGQDVLALMTAPAAAGLFARAIVESGGGWEPMPALPAAERDGSERAAQLGADGSGALARLRALPAADLLKVPPAEDGLMVDGRLLREDLAAAFAAGRVARVPLLIGTNSDEGSLLRDVAPGEEGALLATYTAAERDTARALLGVADDSLALARALFRTLNFAAPARWIARHAAAGAPVYLYRFTYVRRRQRGRMPGAAHGAEIPYVFDSWSQSPGGGVLLSPEDLAEAARVHAYWVAFARGSEPAPPGLPLWPPCRAGRDTLMELGAEIGTHAIPDSAALDFAEAHARRLGIIPSSP